MQFPNQFGRTAELSAPREGTVSFFTLMFTKDPALMALSRIRSFMSESARRRLSVAEIKDLAGAMVLLCNSVGEDAWALRHIEAIERGLQQEFDDRWPGSNDRRENVILDTHALSGHIRGL